MSNKRKTKAQLIKELGEARQKISTLESQVAQHREDTAQQQQLLTIERERRDLAEKLNQVSTVLNSAMYYDTVLDCVVEQVTVFVAHDAVCILLVEEGLARMARWQGHSRFQPEAALISLTLKIDKTPALHQMQTTGLPLVVSTLKEHDVLAYAPGQDWVKSFIGVPIHIQDHLIGFLRVDSATPGYYNQSDANKLQIFAHQVSVALRNAQLYNQARRGIAKRVVALKKERTFVSGALNMTSALVMVLTPKGHILRFNHACEETTGYTFDEVKGKYFWDVLLPPDEIPPVKQAFTTIQTDRSQNDFESSLVTKDGKERLIAWSNNVLVGPKNRVEYIISTGVDITRRRQLEERLVAIHQLGRELNLVRNEADICSVALETAAFLLHFNSHGYGLVDEISGELIYYYHPKRGIPEEIKLQLPLDTTGRIEALTNLNKGPANLANEADGRLWLTAPMRVGSRTIGVLDVKGAAESRFTANDQQLLQTLADQTAVAIENARLHRETQQRVDELSTMGMVSQAVTSTLDLAETLTIITNNAIRLLGAAAASVVLLDKAKSDLWFHAASGGNPDFVRGVRMPVGQGIVGWVIEHGEPALVSDVSNDPRFFSRLDQQTGFTTQSVICVPLQTETQTTGAIEVMNKKNGDFSHEDLRLLNWLATPATIAIENARLFEAEHSARKQAEILREATATLTSTLKLDRVLNSILVHLQRVILYDNAYVFLQNDDWLQAVAGKTMSKAQKQHIAERRYPADNPVYQEIQNTTHPVISANIQTDPHFATWRSSAQVKGWMGVPLMVQNKVSGCLTLNSRQTDAYGQTEAALAQAFANQAAVAIQNAQLFEQVQAGHQQLQSLSRRLVEVQEFERRHIARELHDEAGQALTTLMVGLRLLEREINDPDLVTERVDELKRTTNNVLENLHRLAMDLRPASLDHLGLAAALRQYIETYSRQHKLNTQFEVVGLDDERLPAAVETNLYRIVQEALTNVVRHAQASRVDVLVERRGDQVVTIVEDNGVGFDLEAAGQSRRLGLLGMRERAEMLAGSLVIESTPGVNTTVYVEIPYDNSNSNS